MPSRKKLRVHEKLTLKLYKWKNHTLKPDTTVEFSSGSFLFVKSIIQQHESIFLSGIILGRNSDFEGKLPKKKLNELYFVHQKKIIDGEIIDDSLEELEIKEVLKVGELVRTNMRWKPRFRSKETLGDTREEKQQWVRENGVLTVRWKSSTLDGTHGR
jgi:DNA (cytosine-5)-methyltransferase 1